MTRSASRLLGAIVASLLLIPASAQAAQINGDPLSIASGDEDGKLGASFTGSGITEFYGSSVNPENGEITPARSAGFVVVVVGPENEVNRYGSRQANVTPTSAPVVTGDGSGGNPFRIVQTFRGNDASGAPNVDIKQELTYVNGDTQFRAKLEVQNISGGNRRIRVSMGADLAGGGNDSGTGLFDGGPPRFVGGFNTEVGAVAGLLELTGWSHYEEGRYSDVLARADASPDEGNLQDRIEPAEVDNGAAVQWDQAAAGLSPGGVVSYEVAWRFTRTFNLTPERQALNTGDTASFKVSTADIAGRSQANAHVRWSVAGSNTAAGDVRTGGDGAATFEYIGENPGSDTIVAYVDSNDNGQRDDGEPQRTATVEWTGPTAPAFAQQVNIRPVEGRVLVKLPRGAAVKGKWAQAAQARFVPLTEAKQVPIGAEMDTKRGTVSLTSAKSPTGGVQTSQFYSGRFVVKQPKRERGMTEIRMSEPMKCTRSTRRGKVVSSAVRTRRLWGRGRGRFRTRGRNSSATVRGTTWLQKDTCTTTTTIVREGVVIVKDFAKRKNVRVKAPKRYVARQSRKR